MKYDYDGRELWFAARPKLRDENDPVTDVLKSYGYHMIREGNVKFDLIRYIDSPVGEARMKLIKLTLTYPNGDEPEVIEHWKQRGIEKKVHWNDGVRGNWASYIPLNRKSSGKLPLIIQTNLELFEMENQGFVDLAADGPDDLAVFCTETLDGDSIDSLIDTAIDSYDVDPERIYLTGMSYGGVMSSWLAISHAKRIAGVSSLNICYSYNIPGDPFLMYPDKYGKLRDKETPRLIEEVSEIGMPVVITGGLNENFMNPIFPISMRYYETGGAVMHNLRGVDMWCRINHLPMYDYSVDVRKAYESDDPVVRAIGLPVQNGRIVEELGVNSYFGDVLGSDGRAYIRYIATENNCHDVFPCNPADIWDFLKAFRRDTETGKLLTD